jgi:hypothetical protein
MVARSCKSRNSIDRGWSVALTSDRVSTLTRAFGARTTSAPLGSRMSSPTVRSANEPRSSSMAESLIVTVQPGPIRSARAAATRSGRPEKLTGPALRRRYTVPMTSAAIATSPALT